MASTAKPSIASFSSTASADAGPPVHGCEVSMADHGPAHLLCLAAAPVVPTRPYSMLPRTHSWHVWTLEPRKRGNQALYFMPRSAWWFYNGRHLVAAALKLLQECWPASPSFRATCKQIMPSVGRRCVLVQQNGSPWPDPRQTAAVDAWPGPDIRRKKLRLPSGHGACSSQSDAVHAPAAAASLACCCTDSLSLSYFVQRSSEKMNTT